MHPPRHTPRNRGMSLFEVIIALGVFGIAALALVKTMHVMGETTLEARTIREVTQGLESIIDEYGKVPALQELDEEIKAEKAGVTYQVLIRPLEGLRNKEGRELQGFFTIRASILRFDCTSSTMSEPTCMNPGKASHSENLRESPSTTSQHASAAYERQAFPPRSVISRTGAMSVRESCFKSTPSSTDSRPGAATNFSAWARVSSSG